MRRVDLHAHTTASDGTLHPPELVREAERAGLAALAVTDHDTLAGVPAARREAERAGLEIVPGVELSCRFPDGQMHLLGYFLEPGQGPLDETLARLRGARATRAERIVERLRALDVDLTVEDVHRQAGKGAVGRPHVARALMEAGHVGSIQEAFDRYLAEGRPANVPKETLSPEDAIRLVRESGGVPVLAHPVTLPETVRERALRDLARMGLQGVEVWHSGQAPPLRARLEALARELDLVPTGGTDFHGANKPDIRLGSGKDGNVRVPYEVLDALRARRPRPT